MGSGCMDLPVLHESAVSTTSIPSAEYEDPELSELSWWGCQQAMSSARALRYGLFT